MAEVEKTVVESGAGKIPVFLVWSGPKSGKIAKVLHHYLPRIIHALEPWMSEEDAKKGARWHSEIAGQLEKAHCGILCLTTENTRSEWIHFEAGILSKQVDKSNVCPFLIGLKASDLKYPLALFQNTVFTKDDSYRLIKTLNGLCGKLALDDLRLKESFDMYWPKIESKLVEVESELASPTEEKKTEVKVPISGELVEELVRNSRELLRQFSRVEKSATMQVAPLDPFQVWTENQTQRQKMLEGMIGTPFEKIIANEGNELFVSSYDTAKDRLSFLIRKPLTESSLSWVDSVCEHVGVSYHIDVMEQST